MTRSPGRVAVAAAAMIGGAWPSADQSLDSPGRFRSHRIRLAVGTSVISKAATLAVQLLAFPLAVHALGAKRFGAYVLLTTGLAWMSVVYSGLGPGLARGIALSSARSDRQEEARYFTAGFVLTALSILTLAIGFEVYSLFNPVLPGILNGKLSIYSSEIESAFPLMLAIVVAQLLAGVADSSRAGYQEQFLTNTWGIVGNLASLVALAFAARFWPTITGMVAAIYGVAAVVRLGNISALLWRRPYLVPRPALLTKGHLLAVLHTGGAFMLLQLGVFLNQQVSLLLLGRLKGPATVAIMAVQFRLFAVMGGMIQMVIQPFWPAVIDAYARKDSEWIARAYAIVVRYSVGYALACAVGLIAFGGFVVSHWVGRDLVAGQTVQAVMGLYFLLCIWPQPHAALLMGVGQYWPPAIVSLGESILMIGLASLLVPIWGATGLAISFCIANLLTSAWAVPRLARRMLFQQREGMP